MVLPASLAWSSTLSKSLRKDFSILSDDCSASLPASDSDRSILSPAVLASLETSSRESPTSSIARSMLSVPLMNERTSETNEMLIPATRSPLPLCCLGVLANDQLHPEAHDAWGDVSERRIDNPTLGGPAWHSAHRAALYRVRAATLGLAGVLGVGVAVDRTELPALPLSSRDQALV